LNIERKKKSSQYFAKSTTLSRWYFIVEERSLGRFPSTWCIVMWWM
jgi:hypothetical protein